MVETKETEDEKKEREEKEAEEAAKKDTGEGSESKTTTLVDDTNLATKRMEEATKAAREERLAAEESYAKMKLGGGSEAGQPPVKKEETNADYAKKVMGGEGDE